MFLINLLLIISATLLVLCGNKLENKKKDRKFITKMNTFINKYYKTIVYSLFVLIIFTSFYKLGDIPYGMHVDEAGMAYDAASIANFGVDRFLNKYPVYLINYGGGQSVMYAYLAALLIKSFGYSTFIIRIPIVICRILLSICAFLIVKDDNNKINNVVFLFLLAVCPYFIMQSRWGLDCNLLVSFITISMCLFYKAIKKNNSILLFFSGLLFGFSLYTYALSYLIIPLFLGIICGYLLYIKKINIRKLIIFFIPLVILAIPLILMLMVNNGMIEEINSFITIPKLPNYRGSEISINNFLNNIYILFVLLSFDNPNVFENRLIYNATREFGTIYYFTIPFVIIGIITCFKENKKSIKEKKFDNSFLFTALFFSVLLCQLLISQPNINKANAIFISIIYFAMRGIIKVIKKKTYVIVPILGILIFNFILFSKYYFKEYNEDNMYQTFFATCYLDALDYSRNLGKEYVYIDYNITAQQYIYILLDNNVSPYDYNEQIIRTKFNNKVITYVMGIPSYFDYDNVYIIRNDNDVLIKELSDLSFKKEDMCNLTIFYN